MGGRCWRWGGDIQCDEVGDRVDCEESALVGGVAGSSGGDSDAIGTY